MPWWTWWKSWKNIIKKKNNKTKNNSGSSSDDDLREHNREDQARYKPSEEIINKLTKHSYNKPKKLDIIKQGIKQGYIPNAKMETLHKEYDILKFEKINMITSVEVCFRNTDNIHGRPTYITNFPKLSKRWTNIEEMFQKLTKIGDSEC